MTGDGLVLSDEDAGKVAELAGQLEAEMKPSHTMSRLLLRRVAVLAVRLDRCVDHDEVMTAKRVREATRAYDEAREAEVAALGASIASNPAATVRALKETDRGIAWLIRAWAGIKGQLLRHRSIEWGWTQRAWVDHLQGRVADASPLSPLSGPAMGAAGIFAQMGEECEAMTNREKRALARERLAALIDAELESLQTLRPTRDEEEEAIDRAEAPRRALFDPSREADRARNYEAAAERGMFRALREFQKLERSAPDRDAAPGEAGASPRAATGGCPETSPDDSEGETKPIEGEGPEEPVSSGKTNPIEAGRAGAGDVRGDVFAVEPTPAPERPRWGPDGRWAY